MEMEIKKENFRNIDALWKWVKKECKRDNVESVKLETIIEDIPIDNSSFALKRVKSRVLTIELGPGLDYKDLNI